MKKPNTVVAIPSSARKYIEELKAKFERKAALFIRDFYHSFILLTPTGFKWQYKFQNEELSSIRLRDDTGITLGKFDAESRVLAVTGDNGSAQFFVDDSVSITKIQCKILSWLEHDGDTKVGLGKGFSLLSFHRIFDEIEEAKLLTYEYKWHTRDQMSWLVKGGDTIICEVNSDLAKYRFKDGDWKHVPHADEEQFRAYIENREKHGSTKA